MTLTAQEKDTLEAYLNIVKKMARAADKYVAAHLGQNTEMGKTALDIANGLDKILTNQLENDTPFDENGFVFEAMCHLRGMLVQSFEMNEQEIMRLIPKSGYTIFTEHDKFTFDQWLN